MPEICSLPSSRLARVVPLIGVFNIEAPVAMIMLDSATIDLAREVSRLVLSIQDGEATMSGPVYYGDRNLEVEVLVGHDRVLVQVYPRLPPGHLTHQVLWSGWTERMGWDLFSIYFNRSRQYSLAVSVDQTLPQELPSLVKYSLHTGVIKSGR